MSNSPTIYMDYAATTPMDKRVVDAMSPWWGDFVGNASSLQNAHGQMAKRAIDKAQNQIADAIGADKDEIIFTSGATEANNMVLLGLAEHLKSEGRTHIVTSKTEHASVLMPAMQLMRTGFDVAFSTLLPCGMADGKDVLAALNENTGLVSIQAVNNETGVINPLDEVKAGLMGTDILFHCDAAQALGKAPFNVKDTGVDFATLSAHKVYGPQGIGALYVRREVLSYLKPLVFGGGQQGGLRSGTLPTALIVGFGEACAIAVAEQSADKQRFENYHQIIRSALDKAQVTYKINGHDHGKDSTLWRVPNIMNICFEGVENEWLLEAIQGFAFSTGSACSANGNKTSHVLEAIGCTATEVNSSIRLSFGRMTTEQEIQRVATELAQVVSSLQELTQAA
ncbi:MAG: cysteine desulfurase family protein [Pseudomonadota bacterium]|nr:cysteine desulfurase family protein [Pseudomonadota bacterium]